MSLAIEPILVKISAKGQPLALNIGIDVLKMKYEDHDKKDDLLEVTFRDPFGKLIDSDQLLENTEWTVQWGFPKKMHPARTVLVKHPKYKFGEVEVKCLDKGSKLKVQESWAVKKKTKISSVVKEIAQRNGLKAQVDPIENDTIEVLPWAGYTDWQMLQYLESRAEDHYFKVDNDTLLFVKRDLTKAPALSVEYSPGRYSRLLNFEAEVKDPDTAKSSAQTTTVTVDPYTHKKKFFKADEGTNPTDNLGQRRPNDLLETEFTTLIIGGGSKTGGGISTNAGQGNFTGKTFPIPPTSETDLKSVAQSRRRRTLMDAVEAKIEIVASPDDPFLKSGDIIDIQGVGRKFSGPYRIEEITHDLEKGYKYVIKGTRNAVGDTNSKGSKKLNGTSNGKFGTQAEVDAAVGKTVKNSRTGAVVK